MSSGDAYLAEKLKEILLKLYPRETQFTRPVASTPIPERKVNVDLHVETIVMTGRQDPPNVQTDEEILAASLTEFIKVLKMSLSSNQQQGVDHNSQIKFQYGETQSPTVTMTNGEFDLDLSAAEIADLNIMMSDGEETSIPLKHVFIILSYLLIAGVAIFGNLLVVQVNLHLEYSCLFFYKIC